ncbi:MAG TPA: lipid A deacylase LpxR family protein [Longimicrobiaceae bacterium]|nr:lipid A deacylase LpxR family protein [Longimicrobiaceae bacterium]
MTGRRRTGWTRLHLAVLLALALPAGGQAQVRAVRLVLDNDAYNLWIPFDRRPDQEYTNGAWVSVEAAGVPRWARRLAGGRPACTAETAPDSACVTTTFDVGQKIFTPRNDGAVLPPGERPYAGWLFGAATVQAATAAWRRSLGVEVGVTGEPSLAEAVHEAWHEVTGYWRPEGWDNQVGFEPAFAVRYEAAHLLEAAGAGGARYADLAPYVGGAVGSLHTGAHAGARLRLGYDLPHPWREDAAPSRGLRVYAFGGARQALVLRNLFLDGSTFGGGPQVEHRAFVGEWELGGGVRWRGTSLEWRTVRRGREYRTEPSPHQYSSFVLTYRPAPRDQAR